MQPFRTEDRAKIRSPGSVRENRSLWVPTTSQPTNPTKCRRRAQEFETCFQCHRRFGNDLSTWDYPNCWPSTTTTLRSPNCWAHNFPLCAAHDSAVVDQTTTSNNLPVRSQPKRRLLIRDTIPYGQREMTGADPFRFDRVRLGRPI